MRHPEEDPEIDLAIQEIELLAQQRLENAGLALSGLASANIARAQEYGLFSYSQAALRGILGYSVAAGRMTREGELV